MVTFHILKHQFISQQKSVSRLHVLAELFQFRSAVILLSVINSLVLETATITVLGGYPLHCFQNNSQKDFLTMDFARLLSALYSSRREMTTSTLVLNQLTDTI